MAKKNKVKVAASMTKTSDVIDIKTGDKLDKIKGKVIERSKKNDNFEDMDNIDTTVEPQLTKPGGLAEKIKDIIEKKITEKIEEQVNEVLSKML